MSRLLIPLLIVLLTFIVGCSDEETEPKIKILLEDGREINIELYPDIAPISVENFLNLVDKKFYDGLVFHRLIKDFMIQGGGYYLDGNNIKTKESKKTIKGEFSKNGVENNLLHELGVISMARTNDPNSATSQFFICTANAPHLDGSYAAFGKTMDTKSNEVLLSLNDAPTTFVDYSLEDFPYPAITIKSIRRIK